MNLQCITVFIVVSVVLFNCSIHGTSSENFLSFHCRSFLSPIQGVNIRPGDLIRLEQTCPRREGLPCAAASVSLHLSWLFRLQLYLLSLRVHLPPVLFTSLLRANRPSRSFCPSLGRALRRKKKKVLGRGVLPLVLSADDGGTSKERNQEEQRSKREAELVRERVFGSLARLGWKKSAVSRTKVPIKANGALNVARGSLPRFSPTPSFSSPRLIFLCPMKDKLARRRKRKLFLLIMSALVARDP